MLALLESLYRLVLAINRQIRIFVLFGRQWDLRRPPFAKSSTGLR